MSSRHRSLFHGSPLRGDPLQGASLQRHLLASTILATALLAAALLGCASLPSFGASPADYAAYRSTRLAPTFEARLLAASVYLERFPKGAFEPEVRAYFEEAEPVFFKARDGSVAGLLAYLRVLPKGPHSEQALTDLLRLRQARSDEQEMRSVTEMGERLSQKAAERARIRSELEAWLRRFLSRAVWERPMLDAPDELIVAWRLSIPQPLCGIPEDAPPDHARRCSKLIELPYTVTGDEGPEELQATVEVAVDEDASGRPLEVKIQGPDLFLRLEETYAARALATDDKAARLRGASKAVDLVRRAFEERVSDDPACRRRTAAPLLLDLHCSGFRVTVRSGANGEDDVIRLSRASGG